MYGNSIKKKRLDLDEDESTAKSLHMIRNTEKTQKLAKILPLTLNRLSPSSCQKPCGSH